jgi:hypothetical protein
MAYDYGNQFNLPTVGNWKPQERPNILGSDFNYLKEMLKSQTAGDPNKDIFRKIFDKQLGKSSSRAITNINEQLASSGFRGAGANLINDVFETQANATQQFEGDLLNNDLKIKQNAIAQLLGLNQFEGGQNMGLFQSDRQNDQFGQSLAEQKRQFDINMAFQREQSNTDFWDVLGGILGAGAGALGGGFLGTLGSRWASRK